MTSDAIKAAALLSMATLFWGANVTLGRAVHLEIPPFGLSFWRWAIAFALLSMFTWRACWEQRSALIASWRRILILSLVGMAAFHSTLYLAVNYTTAINAALIMATSPVMVPLMAWILDRQAVSLSFVFGLLISLSGAVAVVSRFDVEAIDRFAFNAGDILMLLAAIFWSLYTVLLKRRPAQVDQKVLLTAMTGLAALMLLPLHIAEVVWFRSMPVTWTNFWVLGYVSLFASIIAFFAFNRGIDLIGPSRGGLFLNLVPLWAALIAVMFLGEVLELYHLVAGSMIAGGLLLALRGQANQQSCTGRGMSDA